MGRWRCGKDNPRKDGVRGRWVSSGADRVVAVLREGVLGGESGYAGMGLRMRTGRPPDVQRLAAEDGGGRREPLSKWPVDPELRGCGGGCGVVDARGLGHARGEARCHEGLEAVVAPTGGTAGGSKNLGLRCRAAAFGTVCGRGGGSAHRRRGDRTAGGGSINGPGREGRGSGFGRLLGSGIVGDGGGVRGVRGGWL